MTRLHAVLNKPWCVYSWWEIRQCSWWTLWPEQAGILAAYSQVLKSSFMPLPEEHPALALQGEWGIGEHHLVGRLSPGCRPVCRQVGYRGRLRQLHSDVDELVLQRLLLVQQLLGVGGLASKHLQFLVGPHQGTFQALLKKGSGAAMSSPEISSLGLLAAQA